MRILITLLCMFFLPSRTIVVFPYYHPRLALVPPLLPIFEITTIECTLLRCSFLFFSIHTHHWFYSWILFTLKKWFLWEELKRTSTHYYFPTPFSYLTFLGSLITKSSFTQVVLKGTKLMKGTKSHHMMLPELSPKNSLNKYGEPPPYKKHANNKYATLFFSQLWPWGIFLHKTQNFKCFVYLSTFMCVCLCMSSSYPHC